MKRGYLERAFIALPNPQEPSPIADAASPIPAPIQQVINDLSQQFAQKNAQYKGSTGDLFRNFNQGARLQSESPQQTLLGYVNKQIVNLMDAKHHNPERLTDVTYMDEVAGDIAVYMILLMAMTRELVKDGEHEG